MRAEKEAEIRAELMAGQTAGAEAVQRMEGELAAAQAKRAADEASAYRGRAARRGLVGRASPGGTGSLPNAPRTQHLLNRVALSRLIKEKKR